MIPVETVESRSHTGASNTATKARAVSRPQQPRPVADSERFGCVLTVHLLPPRSDQGADAFDNKPCSAIPAQKDSEEIRPVRELHAKRVKMTRIALHQHAFSRPPAPER